MRSCGSLQEFVIYHYAGPILYTCSDFLEKNRNTFHDNLQRLLAGSTSPFVRELFRAEGSTGDVVSATGGGDVGGGVRERRRATLQVTIATHFKAEMSSLMTTIRSTHPRFVRCIKSNSRQLADVFESPCVLAQLNYAGVMAALEMRRAGYPTRMSFASFLRRYRLLLSFEIRRAFACHISAASTGVVPVVFDCQRQTAGLLSSHAVKRVVNESRYAFAVGSRTN